jgi:uncharacterized RDD family membrane protein YckC
MATLPRSANSAIRRAQARRAPLTAREKGTDVMDYAGVNRSFAGSDTQYAGFWKRFLAYLIDAIILGAIGGILTMQMDDTAASSVTTIIGWLYFAGLESSARQATLGKSVLGIYVTDLDGNRISVLRATGRYFAKFISAIILMIGFIMAAFTPRKQALHDMIASTLVLDR